MFVHNADECDIKTCPTPIEIVAGIGHLVSMFELPTSKVHAEETPIRKRDGLERKSPQKKNTFSGQDVRSVMLMICSGKQATRS
jgi:hypothetical protein